MPHYSRVHMYRSVGFCTDWYITSLLCQHSSSKNGGSDQLSLNNSWADSKPNSPKQNIKCYRKYMTYSKKENNDAERSYTIKAYM